ncbi:MAG: Chemotaxis protein CheW [Syntrophorhabdus sp. PtaU1.Bin058]|nr:MAG: Chemotaxis protein CheW [Syntrophorhabdus sp. PtaU1.Bin058]
MVSELVSFQLDDRQFAVPLSSIERIERAVSITPLPKAPDIVLGVINIHGSIVPVFNIRERFRLPPRDMQLSDQLIVAHTSKRTIALLVDSVIAVIEVPGEKIVETSNILPQLDFVEGVAKAEDGMILIHDLERFLSIREEQSLDEAMKELNQDG